MVFDKPTLGRNTSEENIAVVDRWIADTADKLNYIFGGGKLPSSEGGGTSEETQEDIEYLQREVSEIKLDQEAQTKKINSVSTTAAENKTSIEGLDNSITNINTAIEGLVNGLDDALDEIDQLSKEAIDDKEFQYDPFEVSVAKVEKGKTVGFFAGVFNKLVDAFNGLHKVATSGDYNDLDNTPTIPESVTESTVTEWGFTKNLGTITGIKLNGETKGTSGVVDLGNFSNRKITNVDTTESISLTDAEVGDIFITNETDEPDQIIKTKEYSFSMGANATSNSFWMWGVTNNDTIIGFTVDSNIGKPSISFHLVDGTYQCDIRRDSSTAAVTYKVQVSYL